MRVLVDTDVLLDVALGRNPHVRHAVPIVDLLEQRVLEGYVAWHTIANIYYLVRPKRGKGDARSFLLELAEFVEVAPTTTESLRQAGRLAMRDFEDAMQVAAALACRAEVIVTRNVRDFTRGPVRACSPLELLAEQG